MKLLSRRNDYSVGWVRIYDRNVMRSIEARVRKEGYHALSARSVVSAYTVSAPTIIAHTTNTLLLPLSGRTKYRPRHH